MNEHAALLSVIVPTYREAANVPVLFERLKTPWTARLGDDRRRRRFARRHRRRRLCALAARIRKCAVIRRVNRLGLAGAVIEGVLSSSAEFVAVIDGDLAA